MKKIISGLLVASALLVACGESKEASNESTTKTEIVANTSLNLNVEGMTCAHGCAGLIQKEVAKMDGVKDCKVDFEGKSMSVQFNDQMLSVDDIKKKVESLGDGQYKTSDKNVELKEEEIQSEEEDVENAVEAVELMNAVQMSADKMVYLKEMVKLFNSVVSNTQQFN